MKLLRNKVFQAICLCFMIGFTAPVFGIGGGQGGNMGHGGDQNVNIVDTYTILPPYGPYMPDNRLGNKVPFEWHKSEQQKTDEYNKGVQEHARLSQMKTKSPGMVAYNDLRAMGLSDDAAKATLQYKAGIIDQKPRIINGELS